MSLENLTQEENIRLKKILVQYLRRGEPFTYLNNICEYGESDHGVPYRDSFNYGLNAGLDYYIDHQTKENDFNKILYASAQGVKYALQYIYNNAREDYNE